LRGPAAIFPETIEVRPVWGCRDQIGISAMRDTSAWEQFTSAELEQKLMALRELIESGMRAMARSWCRRERVRRRIDEIRQATNGNYAPGNDRFKTEIERALTRRATPGRSGRPTREVRTDG
jgi:hypothetical protein